jgi:UDP-N-acetylmuramoylalanine--D-glutamate ligase
MQTHPAPLVPAQFVFVGMESVTILGYGAEGKVTEKFMNRFYPKLKVQIADKKISKNYLDTQADTDVVIKTSGISKSFVHTQHTTATNLFLARVNRKKIIGVTGSKGKSTTSSLIYEIIKASGRPVAIMGNIGKPMLEACMDDTFEMLNGKDALLVLELSSYMLDDIQFSPHIAVITSLFPDHMTYHGSLQKYYEAKKNILKFQEAGDSFVFNPKVGILNEWIKNSLATVVSYQPNLPVADNEIPLLGAHNRDNVRASVTVARLLNIPDDVSASAIRSFKSLPHRLQNIGTYKDITFYDDAISTTPESTIEAIKSLPNVETIFLGGEDRGYDFGYLEEVIHRSKIKNVVLFPITGKRIFKNVRKLKILETESMKSAVEFAYQHTSSGKICLLSTASPSYSLWKDFNKKGDEYEKFVRMLAKLS